MDDGPIKNVEFDDLGILKDDYKTCINLDNNPLFSSGEMVELLIQECLALNWTDKRDDKLR